MKKTIKTSNLAKEIKNLESRLQKQHADMRYLCGDLRLPIKTVKDGFRVIPVCDIIRIEGDGSYSFVHLKDGLPVHTSCGIGEMNEKLAHVACILHVHKSHTVNIRYVESYKRSEGIITLKSGFKIPVSPENADKIFDLLEAEFYRS